MHGRGRGRRQGIQTQTAECMVVAEILANQLAARSGVKGTAMVGGGGEGGGEWESSL